MADLLGGNIVNISVIQSYTVSTARLAGGIVKIKLQKPGKSGCSLSSFHRAFENHARGHEKEFTYLNPNGLAL